MKGGEGNFNFASNLTHKSFYIIVAFLILIMFGVLVHAIAAPNPGHTANQIYINYGSASNPCYVDLQTAVTNGDFSQDFSTVSPTCETLPKTQPYALASDVLVTVGSQTMTLQQAVESDSIWGTVKSLLGGTSFTSSLFAYESGANINLTLSGGTISSIQKAIDNKVFQQAALPSGSCTCTYGSWNSGDGKCPTTYTRTATCVDSSGNPVDPSSCTPAPDTTTSVTCTWQPGTTTCGGIFATTGTPNCNYGDACTSAGSTSNCLTSGTCNCGWLCTTDVVDAEKCTIMPPPVPVTPKSGGCCCPAGIANTCGTLPRCSSCSGGSSGAPPAL